jgi:hypothetical protein
MSREFNRWLIAVLTPPFRALGFVVSNVYSLLFGWYDKRLARAAQGELEQEVRERLSFLLSEHNAQIAPDKKIRRLADIDWPIVTATADGLMLRFRRWRGELQVAVASALAPNDWHELSLVLSLIDPTEKIQRGAIRDFTDVSRLLRPNMDRLKEAFSPERYAQLEKQLSEVRAFDRVVTRQWETEINRRLYPDRR